MTQLTYEQWLKYHDIDVCTKCKGRGEIECGDCDGKGIYYCSECGKTEIKCEKCDGNGVVDCGDCNADDYRAEYNKIAEKEAKLYESILKIKDTKI